MTKINCIGIVCVNFTAVKGANMHRFLKGLLILFSFSLLLSCDGKPSETPSTLDDFNISQDVANQFVNAIKNKNPSKLKVLTSVPFIVIHHKWEKANDGYGFILGSQNKQHFTTESSLFDYFKTKLKNLPIEDDSARYIPNSDLVHFKEQLSGSMNLWKKSHLYFALSYMGDVEHILMFGVDKKTNKITTIYFN